MTYWTVGERSPDTAEVFVGEVFSTRRQARREKQVIKKSYAAQYGYVDDDMIVEMFKLVKVR